MNGISSQKTESKAFPTDWSLSWIEALLLIGSGVLAVVIHRNTDLSLGLPGHQGIAWMAILIIGRMSSRFRGAGSLAGIGASAATFIPALHTANPFTALFYLLPGPVMDFAFYYFPRYANKLWFLVLIGGLAHVTKPIGQLVVNLVMGWPFGSFRFGVLYPIASHLLFGLIGGFIGAIIMLGFHHLSKKHSQ